MRLLSVIVAFLAAGALALYVLTCSVNNTPPTPVTVHPIVGKWQTTVIAGRPVGPLLDKTTIFTVDGRVVLESSDPKNGYSYELGTYIVEENKLLLMFANRAADRHKVICNIIKLTDTECILLGDDADAPTEICVSMRIPGNY